MDQFNKPALLEHLRLLATVDGTAAAPPEQAHIEAAVQALPNGEYAVYDPELAWPPSWLNSLPAIELTSWAGTEPGSWGYGDVQQLQTPQGPGLSISLGGGIQSAATLFIVPLAAARAAEQG